MYGWSLRLYLWCSSRFLLLHISNVIIDSHIYPQRDVKCPLHVCKGDYTFDIILIFNRMKTVPFAVACAILLSTAGFAFADSKNSALVTTASNAVAGNQ